MTNERGLWDRIVRAVESGRAHVTSVQREMERRWDGDHRGPDGWVRQYQKITIEIIADGLPEVETLREPPRSLAQPGVVVVEGPRSSPQQAALDRMNSAEQAYRAFAAGANKFVPPTTMPTIRLTPAPILDPQHHVVAKTAAAPPPPKEPEKPKEPEPEDGTSIRFGLLELD